VTTGLRVRLLHLRRPYTVECHRVQGFNVEQDRPKGIAVEGVGLDAFEKRFARSGPAMSGYAVAIRIVGSAAKIVSSRTTAGGISADWRIVGTRSRRWIRARAMSGLEFETTDPQSFLMASSSRCSSSPSSWK
jgi:hypothetical protein